MASITPSRSALLLFLLMTAACGSTKPPPPTRITATIAASDQINPNALGQPSPLVVRVYELKNLDQFIAADFFTLYDSDQLALAQSLVARRELSVKPGETVKVEGGASGSEATKFVGVFAAYREGQAATWRASVPIVASAVNLPLFKLDVNSVSLKEDPPPMPETGGTWWWPF
ncbi:type VI secretion system lipoprotein TssJ [Azospirillum sp. B510]|uniref:type VI secretion system lipoprotein TssJ n=1 Tax=Azospirillum sp. (strain B510) TaxID=137722 RepID=UPI0003130056|nr:type VI secretion system lipoprotein TssJ [Azospirillum sp. B510]